MATPYAPAGGRSKSTSAAEELVGELEQDPGAVAGVGVGARGAAVLQVLERHGACDVSWVGLAVEARDDGDAAGIVLIAGVVQADRGCRSRLRCIWRAPVRGRGP